MKRILLCIVLTMSMLAGCATTSDTELTPTQSIIATVAIQAGTAELINRDSDSVSETASKIIDIASEALMLVDSGSVTLIDELDVRVRERISELNLSPEKQILTNLLLETVKLEIENRIGSKLLLPETVVTIAKVLKIMVATAETYK